MSENIWYGGLCAINSGVIRDCYSLVEVYVKGSSGGLCGNNAKTIENCYSLGPFAKLRGGLCAQGWQQSQCSFFASSKGEEPSDRLVDAELWIPPEKLAQEEFWQSRGDSPPAWLIQGLLGEDSVPPRPTELPPATEGEIREISSPADLFAFAGQVNSADAAAAGAHWRLTCDLDLGGRRFTPIGADETCPFTGVFDGGGHTISNFRVTGSKTEYAGFFGYLSGARVQDLTVDCIVDAGKYAGALTGVNDGGTLTGCVASTELRCRRHAGGLVGRNTGTIERCGVRGSLRPSRPIWFWIPFAIAGLAIIALLLMLLFGPASPDDLDSFAPVPFDSNITRIEDDGETMPRTDGNFVSFQFEQKIDVDLSTGNCVFDFKNPGDSNHNIVVQLQMIDADLIDAIGSTGRTAEDQAALDGNPAYDPDNYRAVVAESGAVPPGYQLDGLTLRAFPNGASLPAGTYNAMIYLEFYDINTNERAMLRSQLPVIIDAH